MKNMLHTFTVQPKGWKYPVTVEVGPETLWVEDQKNEYRGAPFTVWTSYTPRSDGSLLRSYGSLRNAEGWDLSPNVQTTRWSALNQAIQEWWTYHRPYYLVDLMAVAKLYSNYRVAVSSWESKKAEADRALEQSVKLEAIWADAMEKAVKAGVVERSHPYFSRNEP